MIDLTTIGENIRGEFMIYAIILIFVWLYLWRGYKVNEKSGYCITRIGYVGRKKNPVGFWWSQRIDLIAVGILIILSVWMGLNFSI